jgi:hypothetical protein
MATKSAKRDEEKKLPCQAATALLPLSKVWWRFVFLWLLHMGLTILVYSL